MPSRQVCRKREFVLSALIAARHLSRPKHIMDKLRAKVEHRPRFFRPRGALAGPVMPMARRIRTPRSRYARRSARSVCDNDRRIDGDTLRASLSGSCLGTSVVSSLSGLSRPALWILNERTRSRCRFERARPAGDAGEAAISPRSKRRHAGRDSATRCAAARLRASVTGASPLLLPRTALREMAAKETLKNGS